MGNLFANPARQVLCCWIKVDDIVGVAMIELSAYDFFNVFKVYHHSVLIELFCFAINCNDRIMAVKVCTLARIVEHEMVGKSHFNSFLNVIHNGCFFQ